MFANCFCFWATLSPDSLPGLCSWIPFQSPKPRCCSPPNDHFRHCDWWGVNWAMNRPLWVVSTFWQTSLDRFHQMLYTRRHTFNWNAACTCTVISAMSYAVVVQYYHYAISNAVVTCEIKLFQSYFSLRRCPSEIILFQRVATCPKLFQFSKLFHRLITAHA